MLKLMKWDSISFIKKYGIYYILFALILLLALLFPTNNYHAKTVALFCSVIGMILYGFGALALIELTFSWLNKKTAMLESSIPIETWKTLLSKIIVLVFVQSINYVLIILLSFIIQKFATENMGYLDVSFNPIQSIIPYIFITNLVLLSDVIARSMSKKYQGFLAIMIFIILAILLVYAFAIIIKLTGSADVTFYGLSISVQNEYNPIIRNISYLLFATGFFAITCRLLKKRIDI